MVADRTWPTLRAEGTEWEMRAVALESRAGTPSAREDEILEFRSTDPNRPPRRVVVEAGELDSMDDEAIQQAFRRARPIGGGRKGRPGTTMTDTH